MKTNLILFLALTSLSLNMSCSAQSNKNVDDHIVTEAGKIEVLYFHYTRRCATCRAIERVSREAVAEFYGNKVSFTGYNLDDPDGEMKGKELNISGQTLLIVADDQRINITNEGFMNARSNPDKLKQIIKEKIDPLI